MARCRAFLDAHAGPRAETGEGASAERAPSAAMLAYARRLAEERGLPCPPEVETRFDACRRFLDVHAPTSQSGTEPTKASGRPARGSGKGGQGGKARAAPARRPRAGTERAPRRAVSP